MIDQLTDRPTDRSTNHSNDRLIRLIDRPTDRPTDRLGPENFERFSCVTPLSYFKIQPYTKIRQIRHAHAKRRNTAQYTTTLDAKSILDCTYASRQKQTLLHSLILSRSRRKAWNIRHGRFCIKDKWVCKSQPQKLLRITKATLMMSKVLSSAN